MSNATRRECPGCGGDKASFVGPKNGFEIYVCNECESLFTSVLPAEGESEDYDAYYTEANLSVPDFIVRRVEEIIGGFERYKSTGRLLDIGFGAGTILDVATHLGWKAYGQEVSVTAVEQAKEKGHNVFLGDLWNAEFPPGHFDVVTCSEILEHVLQPQRLLSEIVRILRPGGLFWATTPSAEGVSFRLTGAAWSVLSPPEHTQLYSRRGLSEMLRKAGFSRIKIQTHGTNPSEIIGYYRSKRRGKKSDETFDRVATSYELNEKLSSSKPRQMVKRMLNAGLDLFGVGDSLKVFAIK